MTDPANHAARVRAWFEPAASGLHPGAVLELLEQAFAAIYARAGQTLGEVTLGAIVERVLLTAGEQYPWLGGLKVEAGSLQGEGLRKGPDAGADAASAAAQFVLTELLTVLGNLTGDILTPALHDELARVGRSRRQAEGAERQPQRTRSEGEN